MAGLRSYSSPPHFSRPTRPRREEVRRRCPRAALGTHRRSRSSRSGGLPVVGKSLPSLDPYALLRCVSRHPLTPAERAWGSASVGRAGSGRACRPERPEPRPPQRRLYEPSVCRCSTALALRPKVDSTRSCSHASYIRGTPKPLGSTVFVRQVQQQPSAVGVQVFHGRAIHETRLEVPQVGGEGRSPRGRARSVQQSSAGTQGGLRAASANLAENSLDATIQSV